MRFAIFATGVSIGVFLLVLCVFLIGQAESELVFANQCQEHPFPSCSFIALNIARNDFVIGAVFAIVGAASLILGAITGLRYGGPRKLTVGEPHTSA